MAEIARAGDIFIGNCSACDGAEVSGLLLGDAATVFANGKAVALDGGWGLGECGHMTMIVGGSGTVSAEGRAVALKGTQVMESISGQIIGGSENVVIGG